MSVVAVAFAKRLPFCSAWWFKVRREFKKSPPIGSDECDYYGLVIKENDRFLFTKLYLFSWAKSQCDDYRHLETLL